MGHSIGQWDKGTMGQHYFAANSLNIFEVCFCILGTGTFLFSLLFPTKVVIEQQFYLLREKMGKFFLPPFHCL